MEFIYTDRNQIELGYLRNASLDIDIGAYGIAKNDFEVTVYLGQRDPKFDIGSLFYCEGTEWGGIVQSLKVDTSSRRLTLKGPTFRGLLTKEYIQPPEGQSHLVLKGNAKVCLEQMLENRFNNLIEVDPTDIVVNYQVRDMNLLQAIEKVLASAKAKLNVQYRDKKIHLVVTPITDLSNVIQYDNNYNVNMIVETAPKGYNHILALGKGELTQRLRVNLYRQEDGTWSETKVVRGLDNLTLKFENTSTDSLEALKEDAIKKAEESGPTDTLTVSFDADDADLFDIVGAKEQVTGIGFKQPITQKILKGTSDSIKVTYKVGE